MLGDMLAGPARNHLPIEVAGTYLQTQTKSSQKSYLRFLVLRLAATHMCCNNPQIVDKLESMSTKGDFKNFEFRSARLQNGARNL